MKNKLLLDKIRGLTSKERNNIKYEDLISLVMKLSPEEIIELSTIIGNPVFVRMCCGILRHKLPLVFSGSSIVFENPDGEILMQRRSDNDKWGLPGGCQEIGETLEETAIREAYEEATFIVKPEDLEFIGLITGEDSLVVYPNGDMSYINTAVYRVTKYSGTLKWNEESQELCYFNPNSLPENQHDEVAVNKYKTYMRTRKK